MAWLPNSKKPVVPKIADGGKRTFDVPITFRVRGVAEPVAATLLHIAVAGCRLRSWMLLERGTALTFDWRLSTGKVLPLSGVVAARYAPRNGGVGFEYAVALERIAEADADELAKEAAMLQRRSSAERSYDTSLVDISQFTGYRVPNEFPLVYRIESSNVGAKNAFACDLTGNAMRMRCGEPLRVNQTLTLQFRLPESVLEVHKGKDEDLVVGPHGYRRIPRKYLRRPFEELRLRGRIVATVKDSQRRDSYEVELLDVGGLAREEIARYIHASQLARIKR